PSAYAMGWNPARGVQQSVNQQLTNYKLVYQSKPRPLTDTRKQDFKFPARKILLQLVVQDVFETFALPYRTNEDGNVIIKLQPLISLLAQEGELPTTEQDLTLRVGTQM